MAGAYSLALVGFSDSESATFESFFRMAARRPPAYEVQDEVIDAQVLIVNADNAQALHLVHQAHLTAKVLLIGHTDAGTGWALQRKPVKLVAVLAALDELVGMGRPQASVHQSAVAIAKGADRGFAATEPYTSGQTPLVPSLGKRQDSASTEFPPTRPTRLAAAPQSAMVSAPSPAHAPRRAVDTPPLTRTAAKPPPTTRTMVATTSAATATAVPPPVVPPVVPRGDVLLVAESLVEGRILHKRFKRYGLNIDWSRQAPQALAMLKAHPYKLVAIDRLLGEPDALSVCRSAKQRKLPNGKAPVVMLFAPTAGSMDRIKAGLAGCDAYLSRSVSESEFYKVLAEHRLVSLDGFEKTNVGF